MFIFSFIYRVISIFFRKENIVFLSSKNSENYNNIPRLYSFFKNKGLKCILLDYNTSNIFKLFVIVRAKIVFIDQTNRLLSYLPISKDQIIFQLWHGGGEYKAVGFDAIRKGFHLKYEIKRINRLHSVYDYVLCSDDKLIARYSSMFKIPENRVLSFGAPRLDAFFTLNIGSTRARFLLENNLDKNTKIVLYCPTFRRNIIDMYISDSMLTYLESMISNIKFYVRLHPTLRYKNLYPNSRYINTNFSYSEILSVTDILITDYSSILFDYSFFRRPIILYIPDIDSYNDEERLLYNSPKKLVRENMVATDTDSLYKAIINPENSDIWDKYMSANQGNSSEKIYFFVKAILKL